MESLRNRQIQEMLDEDKNIYKQVFEREKSNVKALSETLTPKKQRDLTSELDVEKLLEELTKKLNIDIRVVQDLLSARVDINKSKVKELYDKFNNYGSEFSIYNNIIRIYQTIGLSNQSKELIKVKLLNLTPFISALVEGIREMINYMFERDAIDKNIFDVIKTLTFYRTIQKQLNEVSLKLIDEGDMNAMFVEFLGQQSENRRALLKPLTDASTHLTKRALMKYPIFNDDLLDNRLSALEEEYGIKINKGIRDSYRNVPTGSLIENIDRLSGLMKQDKSAKKLHHENMGVIAKLQEEIADLEGEAEEKVSILEELEDEYKRNLEELEELKNDSKETEIYYANKLYEIEEGENIFNETKKERLAELEQEINKVKLRLKNSMSQQGKPIDKDLVERIRGVLNELKNDLQLQKEFNYEDETDGAELKQELDELKQELDDYEDLVKSQKLKINKVVDSYNNTQDEIKNLQSQIEKLNSQIEDIVRANDNIYARHKELEQEEAKIMNITGKEMKIGVNKKKLQDDEDVKDDGEIDKGAEEKHDEPQIEVKSLEAEAKELHRKKQLVPELNRLFKMLNKSKLIGMPLSKKYNEFKKTRNMKFKSLLDFFLIFKKIIHDDANEVEVVETFVPEPVEVETVALSPQQMIKSINDLSSQVMQGEILDKAELKALNKFKKDASKGTISQAEMLAKIKELEDILMPAESEEEEEEGEEEDLSEEEEESDEEYESDEEEQKGDGNPKFNYKGNGKMNAMNTDRNDYYKFIRKNRGNLVK